MTAFFSAIVDDLDMKVVLAQVDGSAATYAFQLAPTRWLIGCCSPNRGSQEFERDCRQAISDAERVREMLADVELNW
jgi:hypothetical protein